MELTREQALALLRQYNEEPFHLRHALTVEAVMNWFARELGYGEEAAFWAQAGLLHDLDFERYPEEHCVKVREIMEAMVRQLWLEVKGVDLGEFPIMTFAEAERRYGSDKPDLRNPMELVDVADLLKSVEFAVFAGPANDPKGRVAALRVPGGASLTRKLIDE